MKEKGDFSRLTSFVCDCEALSEEDLEAIEAIEATFLPNSNNKRPFDAISPAPAPAPAPRRRLPKSLLALQHPNPNSSSPFQGYSRMRMPEMKFSGQILYSRTFYDVEKAATKLLEILEEQKLKMMQIVIGFDIEWRPTFRRGVPPGKVAVMQICAGTSHCHVLHLIHSGIPRNLQLLLEDPTVLKVGAGIGGDAAKVFKDYSISVKGAEDLSFHANRKFGGGPYKWSLASLAEKLLSKELKKPSKIRLGNWETPVLSKEQLEYAATDAFASWYLYQAIKNLPDAEEVTDKSDEVNGVSQQ